MQLTSDRAYPNRSQVLRMMSCVILVLTLTLMTIPQSMSFEDMSCKSKSYPDKFSHCSNSIRNFRTLIMTIHGWNGSCDSTFGNRNESLHNILTPNQFFDIDCFEYDSLNMAISENTEKLIVRLDELSKFGYTKFMLVTHSTGGIIAQQLINKLHTTGALLAPERNWSIVELHSWATPINGLRDNIGIPGIILVKAGFSPQTLPDLHPSSGYLRTLKDGMKEFNRYYEDLAPVYQGRARIPTVFYQGGSDDWVVRGIDRNKAIAEGWFNPELHSIVQTAQSHTHNIGEPGEPLLPTYPAEIVTKSALLKLTVRPRYSDVFPNDLLGVSADLEARQKKVVKGLTYYASENFAGAFDPSIEFLSLVFNQAYNRSAVIDKMLVKGFIETLEMRAANPDPELVRFLFKFTTDVIDPYFPGEMEDLQRIGHNHSDIVQMILDLVYLIRNIVNTYNETEGLASAFPNQPVPERYSSISNVNNWHLELTGRYLESGYEPVRRRALYSIHDQVSDFGDQKNISLAAIEPLIDYYSGRGYYQLEQTDKQLVAATLSTAMLRTNNASAVVSALGQKVDYFGKDRPLWFTLNDENVVRSAIIVSGTNGITDSSFFLIDVVGNGGATANDFESTQLAFDRYKALRDADAIPTVGAKILKNAESNTPFPAMQLQIRKRLEANM